MHASTKLDATDLHLLGELQRDARATTAALAEKVGLSPSGCTRRIQQLESGGLIAGYHAALSADHLRLGLQAFLRVELLRNDRLDLDAFIADMTHWPQVVACYAITGDCDYLLHVVTPDLKAYKEFLMNHLTTSSLVASVNTNIVLSVEKQARELPLDHLVIEP